MLGVPALWTAVAPSLAAADPYGNRAESAAALGFLAAVVLVVGAVCVVIAVGSPDRSGVPALAVLCAALALVFSPVEAWADGLSGVAALAFLLSVRLHASARRGPVDTEQWLSARRPMLVGAAITTPAAVAAALVPEGWSMPVAILVGVVTAALSAAVLAAAT
jgi:hypothetical protein